MSISQTTRAIFGIFSIICIVLMPFALIDAGPKTAGGFAVLALVVGGCWWFFRRD